MTDSVDTTKPLGGPSNILLMKDLIQTDLGGLDLFGIEEVDLFPSSFRRRKMMMLNT